MKGGGGFFELAWLWLIFRVINDDEIATRQLQANVTGLRLCARFAMGNNDDVVSLGEAKPCGFLNCGVIIFFKEQLHIFLTLRVIERIYMLRQYG